MYNDLRSPVHIYINTVSTPCSYLRALRVPDFRIPPHCERVSALLGCYAALIGS